jgi:uncharacterized protein YbjQ (UPF0145 family)
MLISTMNDVPGYQVTEVIGECFGLTVRSRNIGAQIGAGLKSILGGELKGMTKQLIDSRQESIARLTEEAEARGANCVLAMRFDVSDLGGNTMASEICAYGTAVKVEKI